MSTFFLVIGMVVGLALGVMGVLTLVTDRVAAPWLRSGVGRPRVWGAGALLAGGAVAAARVLPVEVDVPLMLAGAVLMVLAQVPKRREKRQVQ
ncbi:hypothetical protein [Streptomyces kebangsaanensis]|uniref:hypothetical protein n=1 Tax=Streptomyces kebangsaanensis TaxID=864058 RepID=UPI00093B4498|nr:hypothetical protein [Streptomyces kebangsaanensis]